MKNRPLALCVPALVLLFPLSPRAQDAEEGDAPLKLTDPVAPATVTEPLRIADPTIVEDEEPKGEDTLSKLNSTLNETAEGEAKVVAALSVEDHERLRSLLRDASTFVSGIRIQEAFEKLLEAEEIAPELFAVHNLKGAAFTKMRDFEKARASFERAVEIAPAAFMGRFNLAETDFVTGQFPEAVARFTPLIAQLENQAKVATEAADDQRKPLSIEQRKNLRAQAEAILGTIKLVEFKLLICNLKMGNEAEAEAFQKKFGFMDDDPAFYYGNAAFAFHKADREEALKAEAEAADNAEKEKEHATKAQEHRADAQEELRRAERIYTRPQLNIYTDSLIEAGWIDNLQ